MIYIGIDPGKKGGVAYICGDTYGAYPMPNTRRELFDLLNEMTADTSHAVRAIVESVHAMPGQGVTSMFTFGKGCGEILGILTALGTEIYEPTPQAWKKVMLAGTDKGKDASIQMAENIFPEIQLVPKGCRKPNDGMAEAILLAEYGRRTLK